MIFTVPYESLIRAFSESYKRLAISFTFIFPVALVSCEVESIPISEIIDHKSLGIDTVCSWDIFDISANCVYNSSYSKYLLCKEGINKKVAYIVNWKSSEVIDSFSLPKLFGGYIMKSDTMFLFHDQKLELFKISSLDSPIQQIDFSPQLIRKDRKGIFGARTKKPILVNDGIINYTTFSKKLGVTYKKFYQDAIEGPLICLINHKYQNFRSVNISIPHMVKATTNFIINPSVIYNNEENSIYYLYNAYSTIFKVNLNTESIDSFKLNIEALDKQFETNDLTSLGPEDSNYGLIIDFFQTDDLSKYYLVKFNTKSQMEANSYWSMYVLDKNFKCKSEIKFKISEYNMVDILTKKDTLLIRKNSNKLIYEKFIL